MGEVVGEVVGCSGEVVGEVVGGSGEVVGGSGEVGEVVVYTLNIFRNNLRRNLKYEIFITFK